MRAKNTDVDKKPLRIVVNAAAGRMGARVAALAAADPRFTLAACVFHEKYSESHGAATAGPDSLRDSLALADCLIDFSTPAAAVKAAAACAAAKKAFVTGTTGLSAAQRGKIADAARKTPVFASPNFSPGVNILFYLAAEAARRLPAWEAAIAEIHHSAKKDAPSGTALRLADTVKRSRGGGKVPIVSQRVGDVIGEHTLTLAGPFERLELAHHAHSRDVFARGALDAALWLRGKGPGLYDMLDLTGIK